MVLLELNKIYNEDCLVGMNRIDDKSVNLILTDLPYGTTECKWDSIIDFVQLWKQWNRILTDTGTVILTSNQPFTTSCVNSNLPMFKYAMIWVKSRATSYQHAKNMPMRRFEDILVFSKGSMGHISLLNERRMTYNPQGLTTVNKLVQGIKKEGIYKQRPSHQKVKLQEEEGYPDNVLCFDSLTDCIHPTQKPVPLFSYLVSTFSNEGDLVLDVCMGSGTTAIACIETKRKYIGFELDTKNFENSQRRINEVIKPNWYE